MEIWKPVIDSDFMGLYEVSNLGRVKSLARTFVGQSGRRFCRKERILRGAVGSNGYLLTKLCVDGKVARKLTHRLVAQAFVSNPHNKPEVNHKDGCKINNSPQNLEWVTAKENTAHAIAGGLINRRRGASHQDAKLTDADVVEILNLLSRGESNLSIAAQYGIDRSAVSRIKTGKQWTHIPRDPIALYAHTS